MPDMHRLARGHWLARGHNTPCPAASLSLTLGLQKKDLRETCHAPHPPEAESPPFSASEANSLQEVRDAPSPRPRHVTRATIESGAARGERVALGPKCGNIRSLFSHLGYGQRRFPVCKSRPFALGPQQCPSSVSLGSTQELRIPRFETQPLGLLLRNLSFPFRAMYIISPSKQARLWLGKGLIHLCAVVMDSLSLHPNPVLGDGRWSQARVGVAGLGAG